MNRTFDNLRVSKITFGGNQYLDDKKLKKICKSTNEIDSMKLKIANLEQTVNDLKLKVK